MPSNKRLEKQAQKVNAEQEQLKRDEIDKVRSSFEAEMEEAIEREKQQHKMTMESALNGLKGQRGFRLIHFKSVLSITYSLVQAEMGNFIKRESSLFESRPNCRS